ncbi:hypothetical protein EON81_09125 [bacterium]|nr:MAG: hypothetical protein EON81_09125 [bacterium]
MRDIDLAIAVGGGAYDPEREERTMPSPGELEGTWRLRADALTHLLPRLGLPAKIEGRHLESGDYRIHLGTGHVFDAAGTMVPFETGPMPDIVLPFEGDPTLARIVALTMHLAALS